MAEYLMQLFAEEAEETKAEETKAEEAKTEESKPERTYTDKEVDAIIAKKFAAWSERKDKEISEAAKLAKMDAQQKAEYQRDELQKELEALKAEKARSEMIGTARKILEEDEIRISEGLLSKLIGKDADETKSNIEDFLKLYKADVKKAVKDAYKGTAPKAGTTNKLTKEEILSIKDNALRQQKIAENIELFK